MRRGIVGVQLLTEALVLNQTFMCARLLEHQTVKWRIVLKGCHEFRIPSPDSNSIGRYRELRPGLGNTKEFLRSSQPRMWDGTGTPANTFGAKCCVDPLKPPPKPEKWLNVRFADHSGQELGSFGFALRHTPCL